MPVLRAAMVGGILVTVACGGGGGSPGPAAVASVVVTPSSSSILTGASVPLSAEAHDGNGAVLSGRSIAWSSSDPAVATISTQGLVTGVAPGTVTVTASSEGKNGAASVEIVDATRIPALSAPMAPGEYQTSNFFDHDVPKEFVDTNGRYVAWWGENSLLGIDGHSGYDWRMDAGTPIKAAAAGTVAFAGPGANFFCPLINATTANPRVGVDHTLPGGVRVRTLYLHLSQIDVAAGQTVAEGQQIGLAGGVGCALNPHLHFEVQRLTQTKTGQPAPIDPYGWTGSGSDPWSDASDGAASILLWKQNEAPALFRWLDIALNPNPGDNLFVAITRVRFQGVRDDQNPNNEYVEVTRDPRFAPASLDLGGFTLKNRAGDVFTFPAGATLTAGNPSIRVFTGSGTPTLGELYWGQASGKWDDSFECVKFFNAAGLIRNQVSIGPGACQ